MTKKEVKRLKDIISTVQHAYFLINKATADKEADINFIFGSAVSPTWAPEDHVHVGMSGMIVDIRPSFDGIRFRNENWKNCFGHNIYGALRNTHREGDHILSNYYKTKNVNGKREWAIKPIWVNSYSDTSIVNNVVNSVVRYLLDNFNLEEIKSRMKELEKLRSRREFGLDISYSYYKTVKISKDVKCCEATREPEFDED